MRRKEQTCREETLQEVLCKVLTFCFIKAYWKEVLPQIFKKKGGKTLKESGEIVEDQLADALRYFPSKPQVVTDVIACPVHFHPDRDNLLISHSTQLMLALLPPRQYLNHVLNVLTPMEKKFLMVDERQRRKTFLVNWPHTGNLSGEEMARAGLYHLGDGDRGQCAFCGKILHSWEPQGDPMSKHTRLFPFCNFVNKREECGNIEYRADCLTYTDLHNIKDLRRNPQDNLALTCRKFGVAMKSAEMMSYADPSQRMATFESWLFDCLVTRSSLVEAGFIYWKFYDRVKCFSCGLEIWDWKKGDDPVEEHARGSIRCDFLRQTKGDAYVVHIQATSAEDLKKKRQEEKRESEKMEEMEAMKEFCLKMEHDKDVIDEVMRLNDGVPYDRPRDMIDMVYKVEESLLPVPDRVDVIPERKPEGRGDCNVPSQEVSGDSPIQLEGLTGPISKLTCKICYLKTGQCVKANHIGLPCGHVIYCDSCNEEVMAKWNNSSCYDVKCPYSGCGQLLSGLMEIFLN